MNYPLKPVTLAVFGALILNPANHVLADDDLKAKDDYEVIVVTGTRTEKKLADVAGSKSVITAEEIEEQVITDVNQLFQYEPGVEVTGRAGSAQNINIRGMGGDRVLLIKDGMRMNEGYGANGQNDIVGRGFIDTDTLKQVEVAKGAASSLYGSDALGGIVVFTTKDANDYLSSGESFGGRIKLGYSDLTSQSNLSTTLAFQSGDFEHLLNIAARDGEEEGNFEGSQSPFEIESQSIMYKGRYNFNNSDFLNFTIDTWQQDVAGDTADGLLAYFRGLEPFGYQVISEQVDTEKTTEALRMQYHGEDLGSAFDQLNVNLYLNNSEQSDVEYALLDINAPLFGVVEMRNMWKTANYQQETLGLLSNASKSINANHTFGFGLDFETTESLRTVHEYREVEGTATRDLVTSKFPENDTLRSGVFFNDEIKAMEQRLTITPGVRFDYYDMDPNGALKSDGSEFAAISDQRFSFNLGALYRFNEDTSVFAQFGQGFKVPAYDLAYIEHYLQPTSTYIYEVIPSDDLKPETSDTFEIGLRHRGDNWGFDAAVYRSEFDDFLEVALISSETFFNPDGSFSHVHETYQYENIESVTIQGAEAGVSYYNESGFSAFLNASYQDGENDETGDYIRSISPLSGVAGLAFEGNQWGTSLNISWADSMDKVNDGQVKTPGYGVVDWFINYEFANEMSLNFAAYNLTDKEYTRYSSVAGGAEDSDLAPFSQPGRSIAASFSVAF